MNCQLANLYHLAVEDGETSQVLAIPSSPAEVTYNVRGGNRKLLPTEGGLHDLLRLGALAAWLVVAGIVTVKFFRWE